MGVVIAGTGHRPDKLRVSNPYSDKVLSRLTDCVIVYLTKLTKEKDVDAVISGMALGWDTAIAQATLYLRLPLIAAVPFKGQESKWQKQDRDRYTSLLEASQEICYVCSDGYAAWKMQKRNEWMCDHSDILLALHDGSEGGTKNCLMYAQTKQLVVINCWNSWIKYGVKFPQST